jgi:hypothetical protein
MTQAQIPVQLSGAGLIKINRSVMLQVRLNNNFSIFKKRYTTNPNFRYTELDIPLQQH